MKFSLVVCSLGRTVEVVDLFESLNGQSFKDFEVIVVDQNADDRLVGILSDEKWQFPVTHLRTPTARGASRARNNGWRAARGEIITFPDDDCWYPPWVLAKALEILDRTGADMVTGRAADLTGRSINARFETTAQTISMRNLWSTHIEWVAFFRREAFERIGGYDEDIGPGASTPWQACEAQDVSLRAMRLGLKCHFDPSLFAHHKEAIVTNPDEIVTRKQRGYARGMGYVLRKNGLGLSHLLYWIARPIGGSIYYFLRNKPNRSRYSANVVMGRVEGWFKVGAPKTR